MIIAGIDPGVTGALFLLKSAPEAYDVPTLKQKVAGKKNPRVVPDYPRWMNDWLAALDIADHVFIELVQGGSFVGKSKDGKRTEGAQAGMFKFGYFAGFALGIVAASNKPYTFLTPQTWHKITGIPAGASKDDSRRRASQIMPGCVDLWPLVKHGGRAEAALIAYAGRQRDFKGGQVASADSGGGRSRAA